MSQEFNNLSPKNDSSLDIEQLQKRLSQQQNQDEKNFPKAMTAGIVAALVGAVIWALVTYLTDYQIGFMAIGIGFLVGITIKKIGKSTAIHFGLGGAVLSLLGCLLGNLLTSVIYIANQEAMGVFEVLSQLDFTIMTEIMIETFSPIDLLFYGLAVYYGFRYSIAPEQTVENEETSAQPPVQS